MSYVALQPAVVTRTLPLSLGLPLKSNVAVSDWLENEFHFHFCCFLSCLFRLTVSNVGNGNFQRWFSIFPTLETGFSNVGFRRVCGKSLLCAFCRACRARAEEGVDLHVFPLERGLADVAPARQRGDSNCDNKLFHGFPFLGLVFDCSR